MISLILPYWNRKEAAAKALARIHVLYPDIEVIVVDDGNEEPFGNVRLPLKHEPKSPVTAWNEGVRQAKHEVVVISCVEILHDEPILYRMFESLDENTVVLAAAFCPESNEWHCHSKHKSAGAPATPEGTGRPFCAMLHKSLYWKAGGFDEEFREGAGYEDMDWINSILAVGGRFVIRDDLVVIHPKTGATIKWPAEKFERNKRIYEARWN